MFFFDSNNPGNEQTTKLYIHDLNIDALTFGTFWTNTITANLTVIRGINTSIAHNVIERCRFTNIYGYGIRLIYSITRDISDCYFDSVGGSWLRGDSNYVAYDSFGDGIYCGVTQSGGLTKIDNCRLFAYHDTSYILSRSGITFEYATVPHKAYINNCHISYYQRAIHNEELSDSLLELTISNTKFEHYHCLLFINAGNTFFNNCNWDNQDSGSYAGSLGFIVTNSANANTTFYLNNCNIRQTIQQSFDCTNIIMSTCIIDYNLTNTIISNTSVTMNNCILKNFANAVYGFYACSLRFTDCKFLAGTGTLNDSIYGIYGEANCTALDFCDCYFLNCKVYAIDANDYHFKNCRFEKTAASSLTQFIKAYGSGRRTTIGCTFISDVALTSPSDYSISDIFKVNGVNIYEKINTPNITITDTTESSSISTGAILCAGGVGITKNCYIGGNINIAGSISKGSGSFTIPYKDKYLSHYFVESPSKYGAGTNLYRYECEINCDMKYEQNYKTEIDLPDYFFDINDLWQIWVNPVDSFGQGYGIINKEIKKIEIFSKNIGKFNILIVTDRCDDIAKKHYKGIIHDNW